MKIDHEIRADAPTLPLIAAAPLRLTATTMELEPP